MNKITITRSVLTMVLMAFVSIVSAQELQVKITINSQQVEGSDKSVFENLLYI
jgi:hypothetical protein